VSSYWKLSVEISKLDEFLTVDYSFEGLSIKFKKIIRDLNDNMQVDIDARDYEKVSKALSGFDETNPSTKNEYDSYISQLRTIIERSKTNFINKARLFSLKNGNFKRLFEELVSLHYAEHHFKNIFSCFWTEIVDEISNMTDVFDKDLKQIYSKVLKANWDDAVWEDVAGAMHSMKNILSVHDCKTFLTFETVSSTGGTALVNFSNICESCKLNAALKKQTISLYCQACNKEDFYEIIFHHETQKVLQSCNRCKCNINVITGLKTGISKEFESYCSKVSELYQNFDKKLGSVMLTIQIDCKLISACEDFEEVSEVIPKKEFWVAMDKLSKDTFNSHHDWFEKWNKKLCGDVIDQLQILVNKACLVDKYFDASGRVNAAHTKNLATVVEIEKYISFAEHGGKSLPRELFPPTLKKTLINCKSKIESVKSINEFVLQNNLNYQSVENLLQMLENFSKNSDRQGVARVENKLLLLLDDFKKFLLQEELSQSFRCFLSQFWHWNNFVAIKCISSTFYNHIAIFFKRLDVYLDDFLKHKITSAEQLRLLDQNRLNFFSILFDLRKKNYAILEVLNKKNQKHNLIYSKIAIIIPLASLYFHTKISNNFIKKQKTV
jgi:hypothetical protein